VLVQVADDPAAVQVGPVLAEVVAELEAALREAAAAKATLDAFAEARVLPLVSMNAVTSRRSSAETLGA
jgi:hypothetical protein